MVLSPIYVTHSDLNKIRDLLREAENTGYRGSQYLRKLRQELDRAEIVSPDEAPSGLIVLNSTALLFDTETEESMEYTLVLPEEADVDSGRISVLAPIGAAMLGYRVGDTFNLDTPGGIRTMRVKNVTLI